MGDEWEDPVHEVFADGTTCAQRWPPAFVASAPGDGSRIADEADDLLASGFGR